LFTVTPDEDARNYARRVYKKFLALDNF